MSKFDFYWPVGFVFGAGRIEETGDQARKIGKKALLVTGRGSARKTGILSRVFSSLGNAGVRAELFEGVRPNPTADCADRGGKAAAEAGAEFVIGLGGGSAMDAAKAIAVSATHEGGIWQYMNSFADFREVTADALPVMEIPTVSGTGSEGNGTAVISNSMTGEKSFVKSLHLFPVRSVIDPELTFSVPPEVTACSGVDILCHVLEPFINGGDPFEASLAMTESFMKTVVTYLGRAVENGADAEARANLAWVSTLCCSPFRGLGLSGGGSLHHIEHSVSGRFGISHGAGLCAMLPGWLDFMRDFAPGSVERFGKSVFGRKDAAAAVSEWLESLGAAFTLKDLGVDEGAVKPMAEDTIRVYGKGEDCIPNGRFRLNAGEIEKIYRLCL